MKTLVKDNRLVIGFYSLLILFLAFILLNFGKVQIHVFLNQLVGNSIIDKLFYYITYLGDGGVAPILLFLIFLYNARLGVCCTFSFLLTAITAYLLKNYMYHDVMRPYHVFQWYVKVPLKFVDVSDLNTHRSFPSGHSAQAFSIFICLSFFAKNNSVKFLFLLLAILTAFSRVYLSQHWLVDVTVGSIIGTITAVAFYYLIITTNKLPKFNLPLFKIIKTGT